MLKNLLSKKQNIFFILLFLVILLYGQSLAGDFVKDDVYILENASWLTGGNLGQILLHPYWDMSTALYRPFTIANFALDLSVFGQSPAWFHLENILLYALASFFIYLLAEKIFKRKGPAFWVAILFLILPIHTEAVANITGRGDILALLFSVLAMHECAREKKPRPWLIGIWIFLAIASKEMAVAAIPLVFLILFFRENNFGGKFRDKIRRLADWPVYATILAAAFYFFLRFFALTPQNYIGGVKTSIIENPLIFSDTFSRVATAFKVLGIYLSKTFVPLGLCSDYSYNQIPVVHSFSDPDVLLGLGFFLLMILLLLTFIKKEPAISLGAGIFFFSFLPVSNFFFPIGAIAGERLFLFPSLGICFIAVFLVWRAYEKIFEQAESNRKKAKIIFWIITILLMAILAVYGIFTFMEQGKWLTEERLFLAAAKCAPESVLSASNAGAMYLLRGDLQKAKKELEYSRSIKPVYSKGLNNLGLVYFKLGDYKKAEKLYFEALTVPFPYVGTYQNLILLYLAESKKDLARRWLLFLYPGQEKLVENIINK